MTMRKNQLMGGTSYSPLATGMMRGMGLNRATHQPENDQGAGQGGDNQGGNSGSGGNDSGQQNNSGNDFKPEAFWNEPKPATPGSPSGGSADSGGAGQGQQPDGASAGKDFAARVDALPFADVFTPDIVQQMSEGDLKGANQAIQTQLRDAARQSMVLSAQLIQQHVVPALQAQMKTMIQEALGTRDNSDTLLKEFPSAKDPAIRPMVQSVFDQAMRTAGGNREAAVKLTKDMLKYMGQTAASDMDINLPPANPADTFTSPNSSRLVDELLGRTS